MDILNDVQDIFRDVFDEDDLVITKEMNANDIEDWDSLMQIRLIVAIEKKFSVKFAFNELNDLKNIGEMIDIIEKKRTHHSE